MAVVTRHGLAYDTRSLGAWVALLFALNLVLIFIHELGHAAVLVHHGRRVRSAGFRIYFGAPAFFVDSSDALMLDREARIAQSFGGPYFELIASGVAAIALWPWPHGFLAPVLFSFVVVNYYVLLINLTPMLELDGYWMLSDALACPTCVLDRWRSCATTCGTSSAAARDSRRSTSDSLLFGTVGVAFTIFVLVSTLLVLAAHVRWPARALWNAGPAGVVVLACSCRSSPRPSFAASSRSLERSAVESVVVPDRAGSGCSATGASRRPRSSTRCRRSTISPSRS